MTTTIAPLNCPVNHIKRCVDPVLPHTCACIYDPKLPNAWAHANKTCRNQDSFLPIIKTSSQWNKFNSLRKYIGPKNWIGLKYDHSVGQWLWADSTTYSLTEWAPWAIGEPQLNVGACVASYNATIDYKWFMHSCTDVYMRYTCYVPPPEYCDHSTLDFSNTGGASNGSMSGFSEETTSVIHECATGYEFADKSSIVTHVCQPDGNWTNKDYICKAKPTVQVPVIPQPQELCPENHVRQCSVITTICLCIYDPKEPNAWEHANKSCTDQGSVLTMAKNEKDFDDLNSVRMTHYAKWTGHWIGLFYNVTDSSWKWSDGSEYNPSTDWAPWANNEPNLAKGVCTVSTNETNLRWKMHPCSDVYVRFFCYVPPPVFCNPFSINYANHGGKTNGTDLSTWVKEGLSVVHECDYGYEFGDGSTSTIHVCTPNGNWSNEELVCKR